MGFRKPTVVKPGEKCTLKVHAPNKSFVSLLVVDKSVTLMGRGNDINAERVASELQMYERTNYESDDELPEKYRDLAESNIMIVTNANYKPVNCSFSDRAGEDNSDLPWNEDNVEKRLDYLEDEPPTESEVAVRNFFPETWLFTSFLYETNMKFLAFELTAPHTISSFVASGFSIHPEHGLFIAKPTELKVFKEFFLKLYIPYSIRIGEVLKVHVSVFNHLSGDRKPITVTVQMHKNDGFQFQDAVSSCQFSANSATIQQKTFTVSHDDGNSGHFFIKPTRPGRLTIQVNATSSSHKDSVLKHVKVMREGIRKDETESKVFDMRNKKTDSYYLALPSDDDITFINNSMRISASIAGDLLGPAVVNIDALL